MKAVVITRPGGPEVLDIQDVATPVPGPEQVLVRVCAAGLNRADTHQRKGSYPAPPGSPANIPGLEFAGEIAQLGPGVQGLELGGRVYGICGGGAQAEYIVSHERMLVPIPERLDFMQAACVPEVFITGHDALFTQAQLRLGERVLIHAVGSGVGTAAIQMARVAGASVYGTSRTPDKLDRARELGLQVPISGDAFAQQVLHETRGEGVQVVLDVVGGPYLQGNLTVLAIRGRLLLLSNLGAQDTPLPIRIVMGKRLHIMGSVLRARPLEEKIAATQAFASQVNPLLATGELRPILDRVFPLEEVAAAHTYMESNQGFGKIVLQVS